MRRDIEIHINTGDITLTSKNYHKDYPFAWVINDGGLERYIYGEVRIPATISETSLKNNGFYCNIPYTPKYKEFFIRVKRYYSEEDYSYMQNPVNGTEWFLVKSKLYGNSSLTNIFASQLRLISEDGFYIRVESGVAELYSASETDLNIIDANRQNTNLMLACIPTNNYRYPVTGVGLIRWNKGNINSTNLTDVLAREFGEDGTPVVFAGFDFESNGLQLQLDTSNVDSIN